MLQGGTDVALLTDYPSQQIFGIAMRGVDANGLKQLIFGCRQIAFGYCVLCTSIQLICGACQVRRSLVRCGRLLLQRKTQSVVRLAQLRIELQGALKGPYRPRQIATLTKRLTQLTLNRRVLGHSHDDSAKLSQSSLCISRLAQSQG